MGNIFVKLDVGGTVYRTATETLNESKYLSDLVVKKAEMEEVQLFIDRDGFLFRYILLYLRTGELEVEKQHWKSLRTEAEFYQIPDLVLKLNEMIYQEERPKKTVYKLLDKQEFCRFLNIDIDSHIGLIAYCTELGSGKRFITSIQCDGCDCINHSSEKTIKYLVSITK